MSRLSRWSIHLHVSSNLIEKKRNQERAPPKQAKREEVWFHAPTGKKNWSSSRCRWMSPRRPCRLHGISTVPLSAVNLKTAAIFLPRCCSWSCRSGFSSTSMAQSKRFRLFFFFFCIKFTFFLSSHRRSFCVEKKENFYSGLLSKDVIARIAYRKVICFSFHVHQLGIFRRNRQEQTHSNVSLPFTELTFFPFKSSPPPHTPWNCTRSKSKAPSVRVIVTMRVCDDGWI